MIYPSTSCRSRRIRIVRIQIEKSKANELKFGNSLFTEYDFRVIELFSFILYPRTQVVIWFDL